MTIKLISQDTYDELESLARDYPDLVFQNEGYEYLKAEVTESRAVQISRISEILKDHVSGFVKFFNFKNSREHGLVLRFDFLWAPWFTGVGYLPIAHLKDGFPASAMAEEIIENHQ